jgi:hypothetical protein
MPAATAGQDAREGQRDDAGNREAAHHPAGPQTSPRHCGGWGINSRRAGERRGSWMGLCQAGKVGAEHLFEAELLFGLRITCRSSQDFTQHA